MSAIRNGILVICLLLLLLTPLGRRAVERGLDYLLRAQYAHGGWPQSYPDTGGYRGHVTFNDDAMAVAELMREVGARRPPYGFVDERRSRGAQDAFRRAVTCILRCQVVVEGRRTAWCAQHDHETLAPAGARSFEPVSLSGRESVGIVELRMGIEDPSPDVVAAVDGAAAWLDSVSLRGLRVVTTGGGGHPGEGRVTVTDPSAPPLWARFYAIGSNRPLFAGRVRRPPWAAERDRPSGNAGPATRTSAPGPRSCSPAPTLCGAGDGTWRPRGRWRRRPRERCSGSPWSGTRRSRTTRDGAEKIIGDHLGRHPARRERAVIATKFFSNLFPGDPNAGGTSRKSIIAACNESLCRLQTDYVDLYWMHAWDPITPIDETMRALDDLVAAGKVRYVGFSDTPAWKTAEAQVTARFRGWVPVIALQIEYSLLERTVEGDLVPMALELGLGVTPWSPLRYGVLTGKYTRKDAASGRSGSRRLGDGVPHRTRPRPRRRRDRRRQRQPLPPGWHQQG